jgi:hypothetical protein
VPRGDVAFHGGIYIHCLQVEEKFPSSTRMKNKGALAIDSLRPVDSALSYVLKLRETYYKPDNTAVQIKI